MAAAGEDDMFPAMDKKPTPHGGIQRSTWKRGEAAYCLGLFGTACVTLVTVTRLADSPFAGVDLDTILFFLLYGLFTIAIGYHHPNLGYYSFDRVAQVASILVLGPVVAAWVNGAASLVYPWHRLRNGVPLRNVILASLTNAGLMAMIVLICGSLYTGLGGAVPLMVINDRSAMLLVVLVLSMQGFNDLGMLGMLKAGRRDTAGFLQPFSVALELGSGATAVLVALVYNTMSLQVLALLLGVLSLGMLALRQFASMRLGLERIVEERTQSLREKTRELEQLATLDNLTGLFNRRYADTYLDKLLKQAAERERRFSITLCDIDLFKQINDVHSHAIGDEVLRTVADILRERCRRTDMIARYGGEEFLICFPDTSLAQSQTLCEELRGAVERHDWARVGLARAVTISFGIAESRPELSVSTLVHTADLRLYAAKHAGRNLVVAAEV
jgi:diguanylate cyclase (GGDEF)-like protein